MHTRNKKKHPEPKRSNDYENYTRNDRNEIYREQQNKESEKKLKAF